MNQFPYPIFFNPKMGLPRRARPRFSTWRGNGKSAVSGTNGSVAVDFDIVMPKGSDVDLVPCIKPRLESSRIKQNQQPASPVKTAPARGVVMFGDCFCISSVPCSNDFLSHGFNCCSGFMLVSVCYCPKDDNEH